MSAAPTLTLNKASALGITYTTERLGTEFRFSLVQQFTIEAFEVTVTAAQQGALGDQAKALDNLADTQDYCILNVNGVELSKNARLDSFSLGGGLEVENWTQITNATFTLSIPLETSFDDLVCLSGAETDFPGIPGTEAEDFPLRPADLKFLEEFSETFDFNKGANSIDYTHSISVKFDPRVATIDTDPHSLSAGPITAGLELGKFLLKTQSYRPAFAWLQAFPDLYTDIGPGTQHKRYLKESINEINGSVEVSESFSASNLKNSNSYSFEATQNFTIKEDGVINVSEDGTVLGLLEDEENPAKRALPSAYLETEIENARKPLAEDGRLQLIFEAHKRGQNLCGDKEIPPLVVVTDVAEADVGYVVLTEKGITYDEFRGHITYKIAGTNDPKLGEAASHEYTKVLTVAGYQGSKTAENNRPYLTVTQAGTFMGNGGRKMVGNQRPKYDQAVQAWDAQKDTIKSNLRIDVGINSPQKYHQSINNTYSIWKGQVGYNIVYANTPDAPNVTLPYKKLTIQREVSLAKPGGQPQLDPTVSQYNVENVLNHPRETQMVQKRWGAKTPKTSQTFNAVGKRDATLKLLLEGGNYNGQGIIPDVVVDGLQDNAGLGPDNDNASFLANASYTFNEDNDKILNITLGWE